MIACTRRDLANAGFAGEEQRPDRAPPPLRDAASASSSTSSRPTRIGHWTVVSITILPRSVGRHRSDVIGRSTDDGALGAARACCPRDPDAHWGRTSRRFDMRRRRRRSCSRRRQRSRSWASAWRSGRMPSRTCSKGPQRHGEVPVARGREEGRLREVLRVHRGAGRRDDGPALRQVPARRRSRARSAPARGAGL